MALMFLCGFLYIIILDAVLFGVFSNRLNMLKKQKKVPQLVIF
jgi:hypothetical protein